jgi:phosphoribosylanthranilate isomerase
MTKIKICGITTEETARVVAESGADYIGFVFASSPRQVSPAMGKVLVSAAKDGNPSIKAVGVFVNTATATINKIAEICGLDWVQLSGDEPWEVCHDLTRPFIKVIHVDRNYKIDEMINDMDYAGRLFKDREHLYLLDSGSGSQYGGTGQTFEWQFVQPVSRRFPVIIAGGLTNDNVVEAIETIKPTGVDVSSGIEKKRGEKSIQMIKDFIETVRRYDAVSA